MITVEQALDIIRQNIPPAQFEKIPLTGSLGRVLAEDVFSDVDMPPFDKSAMDGYAVRSEDIQSPPVELEVLEIVPAGSMPSKEVKPGKAIKIMTGAPVPRGADAVIMVESTKYEPSTRTVRCLNTITKDANICFKSEDIKAGDMVVPRDTRITPQAVGLLAAVGKDKVLAYKYPSIAIATTGDELVEVNQKPKGAQIRNSNTYSLLAQLTNMGMPVTSLGIARDNIDIMTGKISEGLKSDILILTGGVSMGDFDIVEDVFKRQGVKILFDKVAIKPGKPMVFGIAPKGQLVFGLPGNPVSAFVITEIFIKEALSILCNDPVLKNRIIEAELSAPIESVSNRQQYLTARVKRSELRAVTPMNIGVATRVLSECLVEPIEGHGSADIVSLSRADAFIIVPPDSAPLPAGSRLKVMLL
ncbi:MAG: gephyrin-like molybdotransferase Glp [Planctomycetota bacterium]